MNRKRRKMYVIIALAAVAGLLLSTLGAGFFSDLLAGGSPVPTDQWTLEDFVKSYESQAEALEKELEGNPGDPLKLEHLGDLYFELGHLYYFWMEDPLGGTLYFSLSFQNYQKARDIDDDSIDLAIKTAMSGQYVGEMAMAEEIYQDVIARDPENPVAYYYYGTLLMGTQDLEGAIETWEALLALEEGFDPEKYPHVELEVFLRGAENLARARASLEARENGDDHEHDENCDHD